MKKLTKRKSLRDLIDTIEWTGIQIYRGAERLPADSVIVQFAKSNKHKDKIDQVRLRIGKEVLDELGWQIGDRVYPSYNPDDQMLFFMCKVDSKNGWTLSQESKATSARLHFKWNREKIPLQEMRPTKVEFEVHKKTLLFRVGNEANFEE